MAKVVQKSDSPSRSPKKQRLDPEIPPSRQYHYADHKHHTPYNNIGYEHEHHHAYPYEPVHGQPRAPVAPPYVPSQYNEHGVHHDPADFVPPRYNDHVAHDDYYEQSYYHYHYHQPRYTTQEVRYDDSQPLSHYSTLPALPYHPEVSTATYLDGMLDALEPLTHQHSFDVPQTAVIDDDSSGNSHAE